MSDFLKSCVKARLNVIVACSVGSSKTTELNILASSIPAEERIVAVAEEEEG